MAGFADAQKMPASNVAPGLPGGAPMTPPTAPSAQASSADGFGEDGEQATPEEQKLLDTFMEAVVSVLLPEEGEINPQILSDLRGEIDPQALAMFEQAEPPVDPSNPVDAVAAASVMLVVMIDSKMGYQEKANSETPEQPGPSYAAVLWEAGQQVVEMMAETAENAAVASFSQDELNQAWLRAADLYRYASPTLDREGMKQDLVDMEMAARQGALPGIPAPQQEQEQQPAQKEG